MHRGYTKAWRKEIDSMIWKMPPLYHRVFFYLRQRVNWDLKLLPTRHTVGVWVSPGMILTSFSQIAEGVSYMDNNREVVPDRKSIKRVLDWMQDQKMMYLACHVEGTIIFLNNWDTYNAEEVELATQKKQALDTTKEYKRKLPKKNTLVPSEEFPSEILSLGQLLADLILKNNPDNIYLTDEKREGTVSGWCKDIEKLHRIDKRDLTKIKQVITWCQSDKFWKSNILSGSKLRSQWDQLTAKMNAHKNTSQQGTFIPPSQDVLSQMKAEEKLWNTNQ